MLADEALTPDSSRFWPADEYAPGRGRSRRSTSSSSATTARGSAGTRPTRARSCRTRSSTGRGRATSRRSSGSPGSRSTTTSPTRRSCSREGDRARPAEARASSTRRARRCESSLRQLGFAVDSARVGRVVDLEVERDRAATAGAGGGRADVRAAAREPADRELRDRAPARRERAAAADRGRRLPRARTTTATRPGRSARSAPTPVLVWHAEPELPDVTAPSSCPGGFSYGDYLRCGAIARFSPAMGAVARFAEDGGLVLGICNGFQILCEAGLLPGVLRPNRSLRFVCRDVPLRVERADTPFTSRCEPGQRLHDPGQARRGLLVRRRGAARRARGERAGRAALRGENPNGSVADVAGVCNEAGNVMGLMPHPGARGRPAARLRRTAR